MKSLAQDLTIVMQGAITNGSEINHEAISNIKRVRRVFPQCEMIISTWRGSSEVEDRLKKIGSYFNCCFIFNDDPGCLLKIEHGIKFISNVNRMIRSTYNGIASSKKKYVLKIRTDSYFDSGAVLNIFSAFIENDIYHRDERYSVFQHRIINCNLFARNARGYLPYLFHPGDIMLAGYKSDMLKMFDVEFANESIFSENRRLCFYTMMKYVPEQYIWVKCIEKVLNKKTFSGNHEYNSFLIGESEKYYVNNFIPFSAHQLSFCWTKHKTHYQNKGKYSIYNFPDWIKLYNTHILKIPTPVNSDYVIKRVVSILMMGYFFVRTNLLRVTFIKRIALMLFNKRG
ncbi:WavE lipopolysaccharide synthesis family protein [Serratia proteamaculans]